jgi:protein involved in polysaccharide export with SLBB domain
MKYIVIFLLTIMTNLAFSQVLNEQAAKAELGKRGISEERFKQELNKRGIDPTKINPTNQQEIINLESQLKQILDDLEREAKNQKFDQGTDALDVVKKKEKQLADRDADKGEVNKSIKNNSAEIKKSVEKGATLEEAISETVQESSKEEIPEALTYGHQFFRDGNLKLFRTTDDSKPSKSYIIGSGDVIAISIYGQSSVNFAKEVTKDGYIQPERLPRLYVTGLTIEAAEKLIRRTLSNYILFRSDEFQIAVTTARTVNVNIFGEVFNNGSFNISAVNNAFNALVASGGPTNIGSVRKIKLLRPGQSPKTLDVYKFLNNPSVAEDFYLQENDYIQVPVADKLITIYGAINRPFRYELLENENLSDLIKYAGGLLPEAIKRSIQITRNENDIIKIIDVDVTNGQDFLLKNGDLIKVKELKEDIKNIVSIKGGVEEEGRYAFEAGMKISDLLKRAKLKESTIKEIAYLRRLNLDKVTFNYRLINVAEILANTNSASNIALEKGDELTLRTGEAFVSNKLVMIDGSVRSPGKYPLSDNSLKVSDVLYLSGGLGDNAATFGYIFRSKNNESNDKEYIYLDIRSIIEDKQSKSNVNLQPNDSIYIYNASYFLDRAYVSIEGAVRNNQRVLFHPTLSVKDLILLAGGLTSIADGNRIDIFSVDLNNPDRTKVFKSSLTIGNDNDLTKAADYKLMPYDIIVVRNKPEYELQKTITLEGEIKYPGRYALINDNTRLSDIISLAGGTTKEAYLEGATLMRYDDSVGYVIINLKEAMRAKKSYADIILSDNDVISVPKQTTIVSITGATNYDELYPDKLSKLGRVNIAYEGDKSAMYYIDNYAGGLDEKADKNRITVEHKNGKVEKVKSFLFFKSYPKVKEGSIITVPYKKIKPIGTEKEKKEIDLGGVLKDSIIQATSVLSLILLLRSVD